MDVFQYDFYGEFYAGTATKVGEYGFPQLAEEKHIPTKQVRSFNYLLSTKNLSDYWMHCFCDDYQFERLWTRLYYYLDYILKLQGFISTDFSLYRDYSHDALVWNCYRNRCIAYAIQQAGGIVIPTASFGPEKTWKWCFDGLPMNSSLAITTNGTLSDPEARRLFVGGIEALIYSKNPTNLIICGKYPSWLDTKYPQINILHIPSYSQQLRERRIV